MNRKQALISAGIVILSVISGVLSKDYFLGTSILICGLLNVYYASICKVYNYIFGALYCGLSGYVAFINGLYGIATLSFLVYIPSQIHGFIIWYKKKDDNHQVKTRGFTLKNSIIITVSCVALGVIWGLILSQVKGEQLAFLDSSSNVLNLCGIILMNLRFKECWWVLTFNSIADLSIWIINMLNGSPNSMMMLLVTIGYFVVDVYGLIKWEKQHIKHTEASLQ